jgi:transglutaminase-like putative cysteine protease
MQDSAAYDIKLRISYEYEHAAASNRTILRMLPLTRPGQKLVSGFVDTNPHPDFRRDGHDFFGNPMTETAFDRPLEDIEFRFNGRVLVESAESGLDLSCEYSKLATEVYGIFHAERGSPHHFLGNSPRVQLASDFSDFARDVLGAREMSVRESVIAISDALHAAMTFDPEATDVATPPLEAFRNRRGVCQDISHIAIAALRSVGIPAGYVSGFLRTVPPPGKARLEGADAMHAWVRAWCGAETGWIEIDPTNAILTGTDHIAVAVGRDYADVAPVKGSIRSTGSHNTSQKVDVVPIGG